jgi:protein-disulfide isomerase
MVGAHVVRLPLVSALLSLSLLAAACSGAFTAPSQRPATPPTPVPAVPPSGVVVETSASGDHGKARVPVWANDPRWGDWSAPVTIVEFGDLECPFTKSVASTLEALKERYGPGKLRLVWKHLPLTSHDSARSAANAAATVFGLGGNEAFWKFQALALQGQSDLGEGKFIEWAELAGVRREAYEEAKGRERFTSKVEDDLELAGKLGASATPTFRINGVVLAGAATVAQFQQVIDAELQKAAGLVNEGMRPADVYVALTDRNAAEKESPERPAAASADGEDTVWQVPVFPDDPVLGSATALVTIVEFSDFQCPFCKRVLPVLEQLMDKYPGEVRLVWKDQPLPFHPGARPAALLARAAFERQGNDGFWRAHGALFDSQPNLTDDALQGIAKQLALPWGPIQAAIAKKTSAKIDQSVTLAEDVEARGTPHFFLNGVRLSGSQPFATFEALFQRRREQALALVARGVPREKLYEATIEKGKKAAEPKRVEVPPPDKATPVRGPAGARVTVQVWSDFQCPFCGRVLDTLRTLEKEFAGRIKVAWRHNPLPFHQDAALASEAAQEVFEQRGSAAFFRYHDALFAAQSVPDGLGRANLEALAKRQGMNLPRFRQALDAHSHQPKVQADLAAAKQAGITGTPTSVINGYVVSGAQPITAFRRAVMRALAEQRPAPARTKIIP